MATYADLKARVADDITRSDLTTQIVNEVQSAIRFYQSQRFYFSERRSVTFNTVQAQEFYTSTDISGFDLLQELDQLTSTVNGNRFKVNRRPYEELELMSVTPTTQGEPNYFAIYAQQLRLYPIPQQVYSLRLSGHFQVAAPVNDADSNAWTNDAEELIRARAKVKLGTILKDPDLFQSAKADEAEALAALIEETSKYLASGQIVGSL